MRPDALDQHQLDILRRLSDSSMDDADLASSLWLLSIVLCRYYSQKVIILLDEYDVPLAKAAGCGYYDKMVSLIRTLFNQALKTNDCLYFAVLTGCLRVSKESIFTGLNNPFVFSIADAEFDDCFGFTDREVRELLTYYELSNHYDTLKEWYDGYQFGNAGLYCPWDVICHCSRLRRDPDAQPQDYWIHASGNEIIAHLIRLADAGFARQEIEKLVAGETVRKEISQELTYKELYTSPGNLWSVLYATGCLTKRGRPEGNLLPLAIPNMEIRRIFTRQIMELFREHAGRDGKAPDRYPQYLTPTQLCKNR